MPEVPFGSNYKCNFNSQITRFDKNNDNNFSLFRHDDNDRSKKRFLKKEPIQKVGIVLNSNLYKINISHDVIYSYSITIIPEILSRQVRRDIFQQIKPVLSELSDTVNFAYDGRNMVYSSKAIRLENDELKINIEFNGVYSNIVSLDIFVRYEKELSFVEFNKNPDENYTYITDSHLRAIETILQYEKAPNFICIGNSFFNPSHSDERECGPIVNLGSGREIFTGFYFNVQLTEGGLMSNIDITDSIFYKNIPAIQFSCEVLNLKMKDFLSSLSSFNENQIIKLRSEFSRIKIEITCGNCVRVYKGTGISKRSAVETYFDLEIKNEGTIRLNVAQYFYRKYGMKLIYPHLPCIQIGSKVKRLFFPMEIASVASNQKCYTRYTDPQASKMIKAITRNAYERERSIEDIVEKFGISNDETSSQFGLKMEKQMCKIDGYILPSPKLLFKDNNTIEPVNGTWDMRSKKFYDPKKINEWILISFVNEEIINNDDKTKFVTDFKKLGNNFGMKINDPAQYYFLNKSDYLEDLFKFLKARYQDLQFILIVISPKTPVYNSIKRLGDSLGIITQCINCFHFRNTTPSSMSNFLMKLNAKLGGQNSLLSPLTCSKIWDELVIVIGINIGFPFTHSHDRPAIASAVGYINSNPHRYCATARFQKPSYKNVCGLSGIIEEILKELIFKYHDQDLIEKPKKIIVFRNDLKSKYSKEVCDQEVYDIYEACRSVDNDFEPTVTYISAQKLHHIKLFPTNSDDVVGSTGNVKPGVVVQRTITEKNEQDFYICSHIGIQGTSRPGYYKVLKNDSNYSLEQIELATHQLCYNYVRCSKAVSLPAPILYAQLVMERLRIYVKDPKLMIDDATLNPTDENLDQLNALIPIHPSICGLMWFA
uniref:PAZ domain-containing protein n=1 Tax=Parastrongyloides trichosuri TaxID=131310 RepID=A0A0N4ZSQ5_PARTI